jgi:hypothetical protein
MRLGAFVVVAASLGLMGFAMPAGQMPPNTIPLSEMMRELSAQPGFTEAFLNQIRGGSPKTGPALLTPSLVDHLRQLILGKDWQGLDRFPGWTMGEINPTVNALSHVVRVPNTQQMDQFLDIGPYALKNHGEVDLSPPPKPATYEADNPVASLGYGITKGDGPNELGPGHAESVQLSYVMNRLAANGLDGVGQFAASKPFQTASPEDLIAGLIHTGHTVTITDHRAIANFGHLHWNGQDVMMPFFINSKIEIPGAHRPLFVPAAHAEYQFHIRGPLVNADLAFYFAIDGKAEFRTMDSLDQAWVMGRDAHTYSGDQAIEVTRLAGAIVRKYMRLHQAYPETPFHGYYAFGVCQDVVAAIELKLTGSTTLFPNTAEDRYFTGGDPRDAEIDALIRRLPKDRDGKPAQPERIFGSLPVGSSDAELATISIPGLAPDLIAVHDAWTNGTLNRIGWNWKIIAAIAAFILLALLRALFGLRHAIEPRR